MYYVRLNYNDDRMFGIEPVKQTNVPSGLYWPLQSYYHIISREIEVTFAELGEWAEGFSGFW